MKSFCILEQGQSVGDPITAEKRRLFTTDHSDFFRLNWKRDDDPDAFITAKNVLWSEGRSLLWEHVPKDYAYYVFIDDDVTFRARPGRDVVNAIANFFQRYSPLTGTFHDPASWGFTFAPEAPLFDGIAHPIAGYDLQLQYFAREYAEVMFPVPFHGSSGSMHYSHWACFRTFPGKQLAFYDVNVHNGRHAMHEDGIVDARAHQVKIMDAFNQHTCDGSFEPDGAWNKENVHKTTRRLQGFAIDASPKSFSLSDLARVYDVENPAFRERRSLRDAARSPVKVRAVSRPQSTALGKPAPRRFDAHHSAEVALQYLVQKAQELVTEQGAALVVGDVHESAVTELMRRLRASGVASTCVAPDALGALVDGPTRWSCVICGSLDVARITATARLVRAHDRLCALPFEAMPDLGTAYRVLCTQRKDAEEAFVSPLLLGPVDVFALYEESLRRFDRTCQVRDFLDLAQVLMQVVNRGVPGNVAEFGSYKGHSGYLMAKLLRALGSDKHLTMFDAFANFPRESGIDYFWSGGHQTALDEVKARLAGLDRISLVAGDIVETLAPATLGPLALVYVDCDSFRATSHVIQKLFVDNLQPGGAMVFEDYGHAPLLGSRLAVHEFFDGRKDCIRFFSQFSGLFVVFKEAVAALREPRRFG
ncbi:MAG TPA: TylF/MycF/NovP-related O-methyltransferase [Polyangia bacterium]